MGSPFWLPKIRKGEKSETRRQVYINEQGRT